MGFTELMSINIIIDGNVKNTSTVLYERYYRKGKCKVIKNYIEKANFEDTGFSYTLQLISGRHKMVILYCLMEFKVVWLNELKPSVTARHFFEKRGYQVMKK